MMTRADILAFLDEIGADALLLEIARDPVARGATAREARRHLGCVSAIIEQSAREIACDQGIDERLALAACARPRDLADEDAAQIGARAREAAEIKDRRVLHLLRG